MFLQRVVSDGISQAQTPDGALTDGAIPAQEKTLSIFSLIMEGGLAGQIIIAVLLVLFTLAIYVYVERLLIIRAASQLSPNFMNQIKDQINQGNLKTADSLCIKENTPIASVIQSGVSRIGKPVSEINTALENTGKLQINMLHKNVGVLATISGAAPMIGFLGTVIGMIISIHEIANAGGQIDIKMLADGLYTAMTTTVAGLIVGIIAYITYNHLVVRITKMANRLECEAVAFLDMLNQPI